jgi:phosphatidylserine/phosphatidylglycerophosphate/cardiolipin synthase-like enzyme
MMVREQSIIATKAVQLAVELPSSLIQSLANAIAACEVQDWSYARQQILQVTPQPRLRGLIDEFLTAWRTHAPDVSPGSITLALQSAAAAAQYYREAQSIELVWTGPGVMGLPLRRTDQALLDVIDAAQRSLLVVSFAVYKIPTITQALVRAFERRVSVRICVEAPEPSGQRMAYDTIQALGPEVQQRAKIYIWPRDQRPSDPIGNVGSLHAKCAVADDQMLFISSANLTGYAMNLNIELGTLIHGGPLPARVATYYARLIESGVLKRVKTIR